MTSTMFRRNSS